MAPPAGRVDIWWIPLEERLGERGLLGDDEVARLDAMGSRHKRTEFLVGRTMLRRVLGRCLGTEPHRVSIRQGEHGKPVLDGAGPAFNLTHSGSYAVVAVSGAGALGVDIEATDRSRPFARLARRFFAPTEREWLESRGLLDDREAFYRLWTRKEAYVKALGTGLTFSSRRFALDLDADPPRLAASEAPGKLDGWHFEDLAGGPAGFVGALCVDHPVTEIRRCDPADL